MQFERIGAQTRLLFALGWPNFGIRSSKWRNFGSILSHATRSTFEQQQHKVVARRRFFSSLALPFLLSLSLASFKGTLSCRTDRSTGRGNSSSKCRFRRRYSSNHFPIAWLLKVVRESQNIDPILLPNVPLPGPMAGKYCRQPLAHTWKNGIPSKFSSLIYETYNMCYSIACWGQEQWLG